LKNSLDEEGEEVQELVEINFYSLADELLRKIYEDK
jgi:hypothetical protein